jgi:hypothetical protein
MILFVIAGYSVASSKGLFVMYTTSRLYSHVLRVPFLMRALAISINRGPAAEITSSHRVVRIMAALLLESPAFSVQMLRLN